MRRSAPCRRRAATAGRRAAAGGETGLRIGVETGPAVVGPVGGGAKVEYGAFGDVVSVAAALQSSARPGSVLVGPATRAVTGHLFSWGAAEEVALSGHPRPLVASYLDAPRARVAERRPRLGGRATLVDRDAEMRVLDGALRAAVSGHGSVVLLTAEPGLGKTRLVQECRKRFIAWVGAGSGRLPALAGGPLRLVRVCRPLQPVPAAGGQLDRGIAGPAGSTAAASARDRAGAPDGEHQPAAPARPHDGRCPRRRTSGARPDRP